MARLLCAVAGVCGPAAWAAQAPDLTALSLESLMELSVVGASKYEQKQSEVAAAVSVIALVLAGLVAEGRVIEAVRPRADGHPGRPRRVYSLRQVGALPPPAPAHGFIPRRYDPKVRLT